MKFRLTSILIALGIAVCISACRKKPDTAPADGEQKVRDWNQSTDGISGEGVQSFVPDDPALIEANNRAVGLMGQYAYSEAHDIFQSLVTEHPGWIAARVNLAIATLNRQLEGDEARAREILEQSLAIDPDDRRAQYCLGLLQIRAGEPDAIEQFRAVAESDPNDAYAAYYFGSALEQSEELDAALAQYERAIVLDPYLRSAYYRASQLLRRSGMTDDANALADAFQRLEGNPRARTAQFIYTKMGPKANAIAVGIPEMKPQELPRGPLFEPSQRIPLRGGQSLIWNDDVRSITVADFNADGLLDIFIADALRTNDLANAMFLQQPDHSFTLDADHILATVTGVRCALWGDIDNDGLLDVYLCRQGANHHWRQTTAGIWENIAQASGTGGGEFDTVDGALFDADHDGDLDIFLVNADGPNALLNNNLDGTFRPLPSPPGSENNGAEQNQMRAFWGSEGGRQVITADLDHDRDVDIIVLNEHPPHAVYRNDRLWNYEPAPGFDAFINSEFECAVAADFDADGQIEIAAMDSTGKLTRWAPTDDGAWTPSGASAQIDDFVAEAKRPQLVVADFDGDSTLEILTSGGLLWNARDAHLIAAFDQAAPNHRIAPILIEPSRGFAIVAIGGVQPPQIHSPGVGRHSFAAFTFSGRTDSGKDMRSNTSGIGVEYAARIDSLWTIGSTFRASSGPGQSLQPKPFGLAGHDHLDFITMEWSDGVFQSEVHGVPPLANDPPRNLGAGDVRTIVETQRQVSSCPVLFVWNGERFAFITDLLGVGGMGYMVAPGEYAEPRPWENFLLPVDSLAPVDDKYVLKLGEPMEEACYLDRAQLLAYELPPGWRMTLDERMGIGGPAPTGEPRFYRTDIHPTRVTNERDEDVTTAVSTADLTAAPIPAGDRGGRDHRFIGRLKDMHVLTLEFDQALDRGRHATPENSVEAGAMLIADGWIEYPYSQTMFAAWQANAAYLAPTIEARGSDGKWVLIHEQFGYPAGMPREMSVPLTGLPAGTNALRIATNQEIYWDQLRVAWAEQCPDAIVRELSLDGALVQRCGFPQRTTGPQRQPMYDYDDREPFWDTRHQRGLYTAFGPATELVRERDDALAIIGPGEEVELQFNAAMPDLPEGWQRRFVLRVEGWCKDMDLFTGEGETLEPIPASGESTTARDALHRQFNTRYESGRP